MDYRLEEVINRYSAQTSRPLDKNQDGSPKIVCNEDIASIANEVT